MGKFSGETPGQKAGFLGRSWSFPPTFTRAGTVSMVSGEDAIRSSLAILLSTELGERIMRPDYGCDLHAMLFDRMDVSAPALLKDMVETAILYHEPRIKLLRLGLTPLPEQGRIDLTIEYLVRATNARSNYVYPFYLQEGTSLRK
jgi:uncharacterized protein